MKFKIKNANPNGPLSLTRLREFESGRGIRLPEDYRHFLLEYNGGQPDPAFFWIQRPVDGSRILRFFGLFPGSLPSSLNTYVGIQYPGLPENLLPIADDGTGNLICIGVAAPVYGAVFFLDHERVSPKDPDAFAGITRLSDSFTGFMASLMEDPRD